MNIQYSLGWANKKPVFVLYFESDKDRDFFMRNHSIRKFWAETREGIPIYSVYGNTFKGAIIIRTVGCDEYKFFGEVTFEEEFIFKVQLIDII